MLSQPLGSTVTFEHDTTRGQPGTTMGYSATGSPPGPRMLSSHGPSCAIDSLKRYYWVESGCEEWGWKLLAFGGTEQGLWGKVLQIQPLPQCQDHSMHSIILNNGCVKLKQKKSSRGRKCVSMPGGGATL